LLPVKKTAEKIWRIFIPENQYYLKSLHTSVPSITDTQEDLEIVHLSSKEQLKNV